MKIKLIESQNDDSRIDERLLKKISSVALSIPGCGELDLFAISFDSSNHRWDILVSGTWLSDNKSSGIRLINKEMRKKISGTEMALFAKIVVLNPESAIVLALNSKRDRQQQSVVHVEGMHHGIEFEKAILFPTRVPRVSPRYRAFIVKKLNPRGKRILAWRPLSAIEKKPK